MSFKATIHGLTFTFPTVPDLAALYWDKASDARSRTTLRVTKRDAAFQDGMAQAYEDVAKLLEQVEEVK